MLEFDKAVIAQGQFTLAADLRIAQGRKVAIIGPSGAGKSTLLSAIGGFIDLSAGKLLWNGGIISDHAPGQRPVAMLFQDNNLFPHLTVAENVGLGASPSLKLSPDQTRKIADALVRVGLEGFEDRVPGALSGGQQSRAALARILVQNQPIVLLDEPFAALGPALRQDMLALMRALVEEIDATLLMVTHAPEDVARIADDVIFVDEGRALPPEPAEALMKAPPPALQAYLGQAASDPDTF